MIESWAASEAGVNCQPDWSLWRFEMRGGISFMGRSDLLLMSAGTCDVLSFRMQLRPLQKVLSKHLFTLSSSPLRTTWTREYLMTVGTVMWEDCVLCCPEQNRQGLLDLKWIPVLTWNIVRDFCGKDAKYILNGWRFMDLKIVAHARLWIWASVFLFAPALSLCLLGPSSRQRWLSTAEPYLEICCWQSLWRNTQ